MARIVMLCAAALLCATVSFAQNTDVTPPVAEFLPETFPFAEFRWAGDTLYLVSDGVLYRLSPDDDVPPQRLRAFSDRRSFVHISPDAALVIAEESSAASRYFVIHRETLAGETVGSLNIDSGEAVPVTAYSQNGRLAAVLLPDWEAQHIELRVYDLELGALLWATDIDPDEGNPNLLTFSPDERYLAVYGETNGVSLFDTVQGRMTERFVTLDEYDFVSRVNFSPDSQLLYYSESSRIQVMQIERTTRQTRWVQAGTYPAATMYTSLLLSGNGQTLAGLDYQRGEIHVWSVEGATITPERVFTVGSGSWLLRLPVISQGGQFLAVADFDGAVRVWKL